METTTGSKVVPEKAFADGVEFELNEQGFELVFIRGVQSQGLQFDLAWRIAVDRDEAFGKEGLVAMSLKVFLQPAGQVVRVGEKIFDVVELADEFGGSFFADSGHAGDVIGGISHEGEDIEVLELSIDEALAMIANGRIVDGKTIILLQHAALNIFK